MAVSNLPPQAYTKDTLTKAFSWLQTQPKEIKNLATSPDVLISLYHRAKRREEFTPPPSSQDFKQELQSLASEMQQFEAQQALENNLSLQQAPAPQNSFTTQPSNPIAPEIEAVLTEVSQALNLSSPQEALRMLVTLGYKQIKSIL